MSGTAGMFLIRADPIFESRSRNFENQSKQKRCAEFDSLHMLKFPDFSSRDPKDCVWPGSVDPC